jgi:NAD(P)-dependent dehydrogenase (short-subunit alcohol dehydrogenase family)
MNQRVAIVTGGNRGLGLVTARKLAEHGFRVVITSRSQPSGQAACESICRAAQGAQVQILELDLASFTSIRAFAAAFQQLALPLHVLVENAGLMALEDRPQFTAEQFELTLGTNHIGHFLLTHLLVEDLKRASASRIVVVSSSMHQPGVARGPGPDFDYDNLKGERSFDRVVAYRNSKLANLWFTYELARRQAGTGVTVNAVCPGFVPETIADNLPLLRRLFFRHVLSRMSFARSAEQGAGNTAWVATAPELERVTGKFFRDQAEATSSEESRDFVKAQRLWEASCRWCGITEFGTSDPAGAS